MTGTDWADQMAGELMHRTASTTSPDMRLQIAAEVLRAAAARGARDMRERAAGTAKVAWLTAPELEDGSLRNADQDMRLCDQIEAAIRALPDPEGRQEGES